MDYSDFIKSRSQIGKMNGFEPTWIPEFLFPFQKVLVEWAIRKGRGAIFADCGMGKSPMSLVWAMNIVERTNLPVLIVTPIAVGIQLVREAERFGLKAVISRDGSAKGNLTITNYERLHHFNPNDYGGVVCDESGCVKDAKSVTKATVQEFLRTVSFRLLCTATAAPNDWHELGTSSEVLGELGYRDMITMFFKTETTGGHHGWHREKYRFREHAKNAFWQWVCSWARALRKPSDYGFSDEGFILPPLAIRQEVVERVNLRPGYMFPVPACGLDEEREERRSTIKERCERVADLVSGKDFSISWCGLNPEGDLLEKIIPDCVQVSGRDNEDTKERKLLGFLDGTHRRLITKFKVGCWGLNLQHCNYMTMFPTHSWESFYQAYHRCYRYGQLRPVGVDIVSTEGEERVWENLQRKGRQADEMFDRLVATMNDAIGVSSDDLFPIKAKLPLWM